MRYVERLSDEQVEELVHITRRAKGVVVTRAQTILASTRKNCIVDIARFFDMSETTVRYLISFAQSESR